MRPTVLYLAFGSILLLVHVTMLFRAEDPYADSSHGERLDPSESGPDGPRYDYATFHGGK